MDTIGQALWDGNFYPGRIQEAPVTLPARGRDTAGNISAPSLLTELPVSCPAALKGGAEIRIAKIQDTFPQRHDNRRAAECVNPLFGCVVRIERIR